MFTQIVVGTDGSSGADVAVAKAIQLAGLTGATLHVVAAYRAVTVSQIAAGADLGMVGAGTYETGEAAHSRAQEVCDAAVARAEVAGVPAKGHVLSGDAADVLIAVTSDVAADLLVVGNRGMSGVRRFVLGSVPNKVSHHCPTNLLVVDTGDS
jgi:nucleotide-binding universal stress UspA family protein